MIDRDLGTDFVNRYLHRIGLDERPTVDLDGLAALQFAHLVHVPFENIDIALGTGVPHDRTAAFEKIMSGRGGWCFELNGPFGLLLDALGFDVILLGAAVLLGGPSRVLEHLTLEVSAPGLGPHLVDVGFGDTFVRPLAINTSMVQNGGSGDFQFMPSPEGLTLTEVVDHVPEARLRFKRVAHDFDDFAPIAASMQVDPDKHWRSKPFATRLLGRNPQNRNSQNRDTQNRDAQNRCADRVTLTHDTLKLRRSGQTTEQPVPVDEWKDQLAEWFSVPPSTRGGDVALRQM